MTETEAARRRAIKRIGEYLPWRKDWRGDRDIDEYHRGLDDLTPTAVDRAVTRAIRDRHTRPSAHQLREIHRDLEAEDHTNRRETRTPTRGDGRGCPTCRKEHGEQNVDAGIHEHWIGDGKIIYCMTHRYMWPGTSHNPDDTDDGGPVPGRAHAA